MLGLFIKIAFFGNPVCKHINKIQIGKNRKMEILCVQKKTSNNSKWPVDNLLKKYVKNVITLSPINGLRGTKQDCYNVQDIMY